MLGSQNKKSPFHLGKSSKSTSCYFVSYSDNDGPPKLRKHLPGKGKSRISMDSKHRMNVKGPHKFRLVMNNKLKLNMKKEIRVVEGEKCWPDKLKNSCGGSGDDVLEEGGVG